MSKKRAPAVAVNKFVTLKDWQAKFGCDLKKRALDPTVREQVIAYGELVQAAYDNLGTHRSNCVSARQYGYATKGPQEFLSYLDGGYRELPGTGQGKPCPVDGDTHRFRYQLPPVTDGMSPLIQALPGKGRGESEKPKNRVVRAVCEVLPTLGVTFVDGANGGRALFETRPDGHGTQSRGTFFGYVAVSQPDPADGGVDVALVWRGTIFKEEWESNFMEEQLDVLSWEQWDVKVVPKSYEVGVHAGICDLYTRPIDQLIGSATTIGATGDNVAPPRNVIHAWLHHLMREHNVKSITATGHSLGGGLATLCAYDVAEFLGNVSELKGPAANNGWKTTAPPEVRMVTFAAPRVGNAAFVQQFHNFGIRALRIENKSDYVTDVPGLMTWFCAQFVEDHPWLFGKAAALDATSRWPRLGRSLCRLKCRLRNKFQRRLPQVPPGATQRAPEAALPSKPEGWSWVTPSVWHVWGYFHVGQALKLDYNWVKVAPEGWPTQGAVAAAGGGAEKGPSKGFLAVGGFPTTHNLELYLYLISLLDRNGPPSGLWAGESAARNPLLLNKSADILADQAYPADWWGHETKRGCKQTAEGHWVFDPQAIVACPTPPSSCCCDCSGSNGGSSSSSVGMLSSQGSNDVQQELDQFAAAVVAGLGDKCCGDAAAHVAAHAG